RGGSEFMNDKRQQPRRAGAEKHAHAEQSAAAKAPEEADTGAEEEKQSAEAREQAAAREASEQEVIPWLRQLGLRADQAKRAAAHGESIAHASLEERVRVALSSFARERYPRSFRSGSGMGGASQSPASWAGR